MNAARIAMIPAIAAVASMSYYDQAVAQAQRNEPIFCWDGSRADTEAACPRRPIEASIIFFDLDSAKLTPAATRIVGNVLTIYRSEGPFAIMLSGHADRSGSATYNLRLARRRIANVRAYLIAHGIPAEHISGEAFGEMRPIVDTPDGVREPQNRYLVLVPRPLGPR